MESRRQRFEGNYFSPEATTLLKQFKKWQPLSELSERVWWLSRFKRFYGDGGIPYLSADELFAVNPLGKRKILVAPGDGHEKYFVRAGWIVMACSGQVYGMNGAATLITKHYENTFLSHDLIRIIPDRTKIRAGYLLVALTHRTHGRPLLISAAYGTSIPHLDPDDVAAFPVARLHPEKESAVADLAEASVEARADADALERWIAEKAEKIIDSYIANGKPRLAMPG